jgi:hypothetical protein
MNRSPLFLLLSLLLAGALVLAACSEDDGLAPLVPGGTSTITSAEYVAAVQLEGMSGTYVPDQTLTPGTTEAPLVLGTSQYVDGASVVLQVSVEDGVTQLLVGVANTVGGYYVVDLPTTAKQGTASASLPGAAATLEKMAVSMGEATATAAAAASYLLTVTPTGEDGRTSFALLVAAGDGSAVSRAARHTIRRNSTAQGSDMLQVSLNWVHDVDYDLHLATPEGEDVFWLNRTVSTGGSLDLDSNAGCALDHVRNENITWTTGAPTAGEYVVRVDLWSACDEPGPFPWLVTVTLDGETTLYQGEMTAAQADGGGAFSGQVVTTLTVGPVTQ